MVVQEDLLRDPARQYGDVGARVAAREVISSTNFEVRLLEQGRPEQARMRSIHDIQDSCVS